MDGVPRRLLGGIRAGSVPLGNLRAGEFVLFTSHISTGVGLPPTSAPYAHSLLLTSIFVHLCEMFVGVRPCVILFRYFFVLVRSRRSKDEVGGGTTSR